jgi:hypothetical protein
MSFKEDVKNLAREQREKSMEREEPENFVGMLCHFDGKECTGRVIEGAPACLVRNFGTYGDKVLYRCPRLR